MPIVGVNCPFDNTEQSFQGCINAHENRGRGEYGGRTCHCPTALLKDARDNSVRRKGAGISVSTIMQCPKAYAIEKSFDLYVNVHQQYNMFRGTSVHSIFENEPDVPDWVIRERRAYIEVDGVRVSGQIDEVDVKHGVIIDYKSAHLLKKQDNPNYIAQLNMYRYMCKHGKWMDDDSDINIDISIIANHFLTWNTKEGKQFEKRAYEIWDDDHTYNLIKKRLKALTNFNNDGIIPSCNPYTPAKYWKCDCEKYMEQLEMRGEDISEWQ